MQAPRRETVAVAVGEVIVGDGQPIVIQSMTNTDTADAAATANQIAALAAAGSELVRITVNTPDAARAVPEIAARLADGGLSAPIVGDFHFNGHKLLSTFPEMARALAKYRINPGNVGPGRRHDENFETMVRVAIDQGKPLRIGVNWGSLDQHLLAELIDRNASLATPLPIREVMFEAIISSALRSAEAAEAVGLAHDALIISAKVSTPADLWQIYRKLADRCDYPLHLGLTEAGMGRAGIVSSAVALAPLIAEGIGDTIRISLTPEPGADRQQEVEIAQLLLQSVGSRRFRPSVTACPGCGRTSSSVFQELAQRVEAQISQAMPRWRETYPGVEALKVAVMGCVVNGPGESKHADIGISLPGAGEAPRAPVYVDGELVATLEGERLAEEFCEMVERYVDARFSTPAK